MAVFIIVVLIFSVVIHEVSHGYIAYKLGDPTARLAGRLTLNPIKHLDLFGSFIVPISLAIITNGSFVFGWAKPVPFNPIYLKNPRKDTGKIALAGPTSNFIVALIFGLLIRIINNFNYYGGSASVVANLFYYVVVINVILGVFNFIPLPPLDGSKILLSILPQGEALYKISRFFESYGIIALLLFVLFGFSLVLPVVNTIVYIITGI